MGKRKWPTQLCKITYEEYDKSKHKVHPPSDKDEPPPPCNAWCVRKVIDPDGQVVEEQLYPWLDETRDKLVYVGVDSEGKPVTAPHLKFDSPTYITKIEQCPKFDEKGNMVKKWFNEENEEVEAPDDLHKIPKGWYSKSEIEFKYVIGVDAITWLGEHAFRLAANIVPGLDKLNTNVAHVVNNTGNHLQLMAMAVQADQGGGPESP